MFLIFQESPLQTKKSISLIEFIISVGLGAQIIIGVSIFSSKENGTENVFTSETFFI